MRFTTDIVRGMGGEGSRAEEVARAITDGWLHSANFELYEDTLPVLAELLAERGAAGELVAHARDASSAGRVLELAQGVGLPLADDVALRARRVGLSQLDGVCALEVMIFDRDGVLIGHAKGW